MGQCMSRKAAGAFAASAAAAHTRPTSKMHKVQSPDDENNKELISQKPPVRTKGVAMSFGFKRRPATAPSIASNASAARRLANAHVVDRNGNSNDTDILTENVVPIERSTPRLAPPKKEPNATKTVSRFGFRHSQINRLNKVADLNNQAAEFGNNNTRPRPNSSVTDNNKKRMGKVGYSQSQVGRFTLQSTQLPRPESAHLIETKTAKTLANTNRKVAMYQHVEDTSSKDGSLTEDSGVGSHVSGSVGNNDTGQEVERLESSPSLGRRHQKFRNLEMVVTSNNTFDVRDLNDSTESVAPIPKLPSAFTSDNNKSNYHNTGLVRERTLEYQRHIDRDSHRKISVTSSEGFSDDYGEEEKTYKDRCRNEKAFIKSCSQIYNITKTPSKTFFKSKPNVKEITHLKHDSSPPSSDEQEWVHGGEAMADEISFSLSSSDESKDKGPEPIKSTSSSHIGSTLQTLLCATGTVTKAEVKNVLLTIEDSNFAALAAASNAGALLDDETLFSPINSISCSDTEEILRRKMQRSSSNSKDINEKLTPPSPGTPTNASNSLSLSEDKDDFLIDDEIADQPALVFEDRTIAVNDNISMSQNNSEKTIIDSTPKPKRRGLPQYESSPLLSRSKKFLNSRTGSLDTLSSCESIASDDLMMNYDFSQSSGVEDFDKQSSGYPSLNETLISKTDGELERDWPSLMANCAMDKTFKSNASRTRLLRSRTSTPNSIPDSPKSLDSRVTGRSRPSVTNSPIKPRLGNHLTNSGYDSDDSIRLDRANHTAMKQDIISIKTMLLKLRRVLNESETHNPFESHAVLTNGLFNSLCPNGDENTQNDDMDDARMELAELRRQVLFLQGQLEDKDKTVQQLQEQMIKLANENYHANSAPASTIAQDSNMCNAATQTERMRPISAGPSLLNESPLDENTGSLVSVNESRKSRPPIQSDSPASKRTPSRLWRKPGEPPSPQRYSNSSQTSSIPRRANSRTRTPSTHT